jgi:hypothetical protein
MLRSYFHNFYKVYEYQESCIKTIDFLRLPRPQGERRKSIYSPWGWGK